MLLFSNFKLGSITLKNRVVMAPLTRCRAIDNIPNELMATYYKQRSGAGLIITEGISPSPNGLGYARIPGLFSKEQVKGWKLVTNAVHEGEGKIFAQIMHTGRVSHLDNMPEGSKILAPSAIGISGEMFTDKNGLQSHPVPNEMTLDEISQTQDEYVNAAKNAMEAGFDGIELHSANGYLLDQFINPCSNQRDDIYGGTIENRTRFVLEVTSKVVNEIGADKVGIRISPYGVFNDMQTFADLEETYEYLAYELNKLNIVYIHIVDHSAMGAPIVPNSIKDKIKNAFEKSIIASGGFETESAEKALNEDNGDLIAFGRPFISNPDLIERMKNNLPLQEGDSETFYTPGEKGYTDYQTIEQS